MIDYIKLEHTSDHADWVVVNWCMGNVCNYACSYCPDSLHNGTRPWWDLELVKNFCDKIINHYSGKKIYLEFTGGEITLWKDFLHLTQYLKSNNIKVGCISNLSRTTRYWEELKNNIDHVCASFHSEYATEDHFFKIIELIKDDIRTHINVMMSPENFDKCMNVVKRATNLTNITIALQPLLIDLGHGVDLYQYTTQQKDVIDNQHALTKDLKNTKKFQLYRGSMRMIGKSGEVIKTLPPHQFIAHGLNNWEGWSCSAGLEQIVIDTTGMIYRGWCQVGGAIGNIRDNNLMLPTTKIICNKNFCHCNFDIMCTKEKYV